MTDELLCFTEEQLALIEDNSHEITLWYCDFCSNWFENKEDLLNHYFFPNHPEEIFCNHSAGSKAA